MLVPMPMLTPTLMPPAAEKPVRPNDTQPIQPQDSNTKEDQHEHQRRLQREQQRPERTTIYEIDKTTRPDWMQPDDQAEHLSQPTPYRATKRRCTTHGQDTESTQRAQHRAHNAQHAQHTMHSTQRTARTAAATCYKEALEKEKVKKIR